MANRQEVPGMLAVSGEVISPPEGRRGVYISSINKYKSDCVESEVGPLIMAPGNPQVENIIPPIAAPTGFQVPYGTQVIYYYD